MVNLTDHGKQTRIQEMNCTTRLYGTHQKIFISAINSLLSITAFLGNVLIIYAAQKLQSIHPPLRLLLCCLAITALCDGPHYLASPLCQLFIVQRVLQSLLLFCSP